MLKNAHFFKIYHFVYFRVFCLIEGKEMEENISMLHQVGLYVPQNLQMIIRRSTFFFLNYKPPDFQRIWAIKSKRMFFILNFEKFFLQELSETLSWYDNFAFLTEGVFMVSLRQLVIRKARKIMKKNLCTSFVMSHLNLMMCFRHSIRFGQSICPFRQS